MKIIALSDTHMPRMAKSLPGRLVEELKDADYILHAGDWQTMDVYEELKKFAPVDGVCGNVDSGELVGKFGLQKVRTFEDFRIGIVHGHGKKGTTEQRALAAFADEEVDLILFGHSHIPLLKEVNGILLLNPGSPTDKRRQEHYSFAIIRLGSEMAVEHVFYSSKL
ncbi:metallophosphoesterase family protein [Pradoshia sp.]|uniref:metallophosphoesterase family protein n=1 Tax=Pradoshia sp. TaxID=2651281 RepID=UPI003F0E7521